MSAAFQIFTLPSQQALDSSARVRAGAKLYFYLTGTSTPASAYADSNLTTPIANPLTADSGGVFAQFFLDPDVTYRIVMKDAAGSVIGGPWDPANEKVLTASSVGALVTSDYIGTTLDSLKRTQAEIDAGVTPTNYAYPPGNVLRYGADPTGVADSINAFEAAISVWNDYRTFDATLMANNFGSKCATRGGTVIVPGGRYRITRPIPLSPFVTLRGEHALSSIIGTGFALTYDGNAADQIAPTIVCDFPNGEFWYAIDTGNWRQKLQSDHTTPVDTPYRVYDIDDQFAGQDKDNQVGTACPGACVFDLRVDGNGTAAGGIRMQMWFYGEIDRVIVHDVGMVGLCINGSFETRLGALGLYAPIGVASLGNSSWEQSGGELLIYCVDTSMWVSGNQTLINTWLYDFQMGSTARTTPAGVEAKWYTLTKKAIVAHWCTNITIKHLGAALCNVAVECYKADLCVYHWENEYTGSSNGAETWALCIVRGGSVLTIHNPTSKAADQSVAPVYLATGDDNSRLTVYNPGVMSLDGTFTKLVSETSSLFEIDIYGYADTEGVLGTSCPVSILNVTRVHNPMQVGTPYLGTVTLYCDQTGDGTIAGLKSSQPGTVDSALKFIESNPHLRRFQLNLSDNDTHTISIARTLRDVDVLFVRDGLGGTAAILTATETITIADRAEVRIGCTMSGWSTSANAMFLVRGPVFFDIGFSTITIPNSKVIWKADTNTTVRLTVTGSTMTVNFGTSSGLCAGGTNEFINYEDSCFQVATTGTPALEAISTGKVHKIYSPVLAP